MAKGWIKLHRSLLDSDIWDGKGQPFDMRSAWIDLLMLANHEDKTVIFDYENVVVERGQFITSVRKLGERWKWGKERTLKYLRLLERLGMITKDSNARRTLITIENYGKYQSCQDSIEDSGEDSVEDTNRTLTEHCPSTNKNIKNDKKDNNNKRTFTPPTVEEVKEYCIERNNGIDPEAFVNFYESKGWMVGKNKMKDWKASVRTWERARKDPSKQPKKEKPKFADFNQRKYDYNALVSEIANK